MLQANSTLIQSETGTTLVSALGKSCKLFDGEVVLDITMLPPRLRWRSDKCLGGADTISQSSTLPSSDDPTSLSEGCMDNIFKLTIETLLIRLRVGPKVMPREASLHARQQLTLK